MGLFSKIFEKKICDICGGEIGLLGNRKLEDGNLCKECANKLSPWFSDRRSSTIEQIKEQLDYREANKEALNNFKVTKTLGEYYKVLIDETQNKFIVTRESNWKNSNPDIIDLDQVTGCRFNVDEDKDEVYTKDAEGKSVSYEPKIYKYYYNFDIIMNLNHPYFDEIRFRINNSRAEGVHDIIPGGPRPAGNIQNKMGSSLNKGNTFMRAAAGAFGGMMNTIDHTASVAYSNYYRMAEDIVNSITQVQSDIREERAAANAPKTAVTCPFCGASTIPDENGCCEYCGGAVNG